MSTDGRNDGRTGGRTKNYSPLQLTSGDNKPWGQTYDSARKHYCRFLNISFKSGSDFTLVSYEKPILPFVYFYNARGRVLGACVTKHL